MMKGKNSYNVKIRFKLTDDELKKVHLIQRKGKESARVIKRARVLELFHKGMTSPTISEYVGVTAETARRIGTNYLKGGLERALYDLPRPGCKKKLLSPRKEEEIVAIVCSDPPEGYSRWTISLLKQETIKRKIVPSIGDETIRLVLKRHKLKPWREKNVVYSYT